MRKSSFVNPLMLIFSLIGAAAAYLFGEALLMYLVYLPYWLQCGIYLLFIAAICCFVMWISEIIHSGNYILKRKQEFNQTCAKAALIFLPLAFALGALTQFLYGIAGVSTEQRPNYQGTMIVCDISGSMSQNDPEMLAVDAILSFIDTFDLDEYLGIIVFNDRPTVVHEYAPLETENAREELKEYIRTNVGYGGNTDIQAALLSAISQMRMLENTDWPGIVLLFSDGLSSVDYNRLQSASLGDRSNPRNKIPVNTMYYSGNPLDGYQMSMIAQKTGGVYTFMGTGKENNNLRDIFTYSRSLISEDRPHLLQSYFGEARYSIVRIITQAIFILLWGVLTSVLLVVFLNNNRLIKNYLISRIIASLLLAGTFTVLMLLFDYNGGMIARAVLAAELCVMYPPSYSWY